MSSASILSVIQHYQRSIEHSQDDEGRLLHCINKLYKLPVKVEHLQETGVGKTVNSLRKYNGEIGVAAKALVTKWKAMVAAEEEPVEVSNCQSKDDDDDDANNANGQGSSDDDHYNHNHTQNKTPTQERVLTNTLSENASKEQQSGHRKESNSEHRSKSRNEGKTHKTSHEHSSSKQKRYMEQEEKEMPSEKKSKYKERDNEFKNRENVHNKSSREKSDGNRELSGKQSTSRDAKTTSSNASHQKIGGVYKEKNENEKGEKRRDHSSSKHQASNKSDKESSKNSESEKNDTIKDKRERSKESKHEKTKSSSKDHSHRDKQHKSLTSHSGSSSSKSSSSTIEGPSTSEPNTRPDSCSNRKRPHDSDSNDASPSKVKVPKMPRTKPKAIENEDEVDADDGIDSSMGTNFADVLGMLNMPTKKSKKTLNNIKSPTVSAPSKSNAFDKPTSSSSSKNAKIDYKQSSISSAFTTAKLVDEKPELLTASAKLAPLDPSIVLELPTISTNYKPLPHNKTVMECVYRNTGVLASIPKPPVRTLSDAEAISHGISSKTMRTKIYSGIKTGQVFQVPSLFDLCIRILQKNIDALEYTGGVPFEVLRSVLERATPHQLLTFEEYNPYLMEDSDCLWQIHVQRNFRIKKRMEMESWREMFLRCEEEKEQKLNSLTATIKQSQKIIAAPIRKTQMAFVDSMVKPPRNVLRKQEQYGTKAKMVATPAARVAALSSVTPNAAKVGDTRLRVASTVRDAAQVSHAPLRAKKAPLMAKTLQFMRGRHKR